jgi:hypothetical protein
MMKKDEQAFDRRMAMRKNHIKLSAQMCDAGKMLYGAAILDSEDKMIRSILI